MADRWAVMGAVAAVAVALVVASVVLGSLAVTAAAWTAALAAWWGPRRRGVQDRPSRVLAGVGFSLLAVAWTGIALTGAWPSPGEPPHGVFSPLAFLGILAGAGALVRWVQLRARGHLLDGLLESTLVAAALAAIVAELLFAPQLGQAGTAIDPLSGVALPVAMALVVGIAVRLVLTGAERLPSAWLFLAASLVSLFADTRYSLDGETVSAMGNAGWTIAYLLVGAALAHPSIGELAAPRAQERSTIASPPWTQLGFIAAALGIVGILQAGNAITSPAGALPGLATAALVLAVLWRIVRLLRQRQQEAGQQAALTALSQACLEAETVEDLLVTTARVTSDTLGVPTRTIARARGANGAVTGEHYSAWTIDDTRVLVCDADPRRRAGAGAEAFLTAVTSIAAAGLRRLGTEATLRHRSLHDDLTGLPTRALLRDRLRHALTAAAREEQLTGVVFVDLDGFKQVNDTYGHAVGDVVLTVVADALLACVRGGDTVGRISGDEFVIIAPEVTAQGLDDLAGRALTAVQRAARYLPAEVAGLRLSASVGTSIGHHTASVDELLTSADDAMYLVKGHGGNDHSPTPRYHRAPREPIIDLRSREDALRGRAGREPDRRRPLSP